MRLTGYKHFSIEPIGDIHFRFNKNARVKKGKVIWTRDVTIKEDTRLNIDTDTYQKLMKEMKAKGSDLLTDGKKFYTTFGEQIAEIEHPQFIKELELERELYNK